MCSMAIQYYFLNPISLQGVLDILDYFIFDNYIGLRQNDLHRLIYLPTWTPADAASCEKLGVSLWAGIEVSRLCSIIFASWLYLNI